MDRKRRWNNLYPEKKSSIMISLPSPVTSTRDDSFYSIKTWSTFFGIKHVRVGLIFLLILFVLASLYLSFSSNTDEHQMLSKRAHCPKVLSRPRDFVAVKPYEVELISQVMMFNALQNSVGISKFYLISLSLATLFEHPFPNSPVVV